MKPITKLRFRSQSNHKEARGSNPKNLCLFEIACHITCEKKLRHASLFEVFFASVLRNISKGV